MLSIDLGNYTLDSLQIFFPWDDDLYTYLKSKGFGKKAGMKVLPLIYSDNIENHTGKTKSRRKFVIPPEKFGKTYQQVEWEETDKPSQPIIPSEKPMVNVKVEGKNIVFKVVPCIAGKNQYHLEFSSMAAFGKMYSNWFGIYFSTEEFLNLIGKIKEKVKTKPVKIEIKKELKQNQREEIAYGDVPVIQYEFSIGEFDFARDYIVMSGFQDKELPSLVFDRNDKLASSIMTPIAKVGVLHTTAKAGFDNRNTQSVVKISQDQITLSKRGKKAKVKGILKVGNYGNVLILDCDIFVSTAFKLADMIKKHYAILDMKINSIYEGDNLGIMSKFPGKKVDLIYAGAPYDVARDMKPYTKLMEPRIRECYRLLKDGGAMYLHCDDYISAHFKRLMDVIFDENNFVKEIIGFRQSGAHSFAPYFTRSHDTVLFYTKGAPKIPITDVWTDIPSIRTQSALLERIIATSSTKGDIILDPFAGSGTTLVAAQKLGRNWVGIGSPNDCKLMQEHLKNEFSIDVPIIR